MILEGKQIHRLHAFEHGFAVFVIKKGRKFLYGIVHSDGRIRIEPVYAFAGIYKRNGGWFCQFGDFNSGWLVASLDDWNDMGKPREKTNALDFHGVYYMIERKGGYKGVYKKTPDKVLLEPVYRRIFFKEDAFVVKNTKNKWGVFSLKGKVIIPFEYDYISEYEGYYLVSKEIAGERKHGLIDRKGRMRIPLICDTISPINDKYVSVAEFDKEGNTRFWKIMDIFNNEIQPAGKELEQFDFNDIMISSYNPDHNKLDVQIFSHYGGIIGIDEDEKTYHFIIPIANNYVHSCSDGNYMIHRHDTMKYGLVSSKGKGLVPCEYDYMDYGDDSNLIVVNKEDEWFCINSRNERVLF